METIWEKVEDHDGGCRTPELLPETVEEEYEFNLTSSSSIGDNSDLDHDEDVESNSNNNNGSFDDAIEALEQAFPIRKGISSFYNGKSKSFTSLADVLPSTSSIQDIAKPENAYTRKRRNLGAFKLSKISKKPKTTTMHFTMQSQINRPLPLRSFSMVNLHRCDAAKIGNC